MSNEQLNELFNDYLANQIELLYLASKGKLPQWFIKSELNKIKVISEIINTKDK